MIETTTIERFVLVFLRKPSPYPHTQNWLWVREGNTGNFRALFEISRQFLPVEAGLTRLPVDTGTAASSITIRAGVPGRIEAVKSGAESFLRSSSTITSWRSVGAWWLCPANGPGGPAFPRCGPQARWPGPDRRGRPNDGRQDFMQVGEPSTVSARVCSSIWGSWARSRSRMSDS